MLERLIALAAVDRVDVPEVGRRFLDDVPAGVLAQRRDQHQRAGVVDPGPDGHDVAVDAGEMRLAEVEFKSHGYPGKFAGNLPSLARKLEARRA